jgi:hypothetical protein
MYFLKTRYVGIWPLKMMLIACINVVCIEKFVWKMSWLLIVKHINDSIHWHGAGRICNCLNRLLHEVLGCAPAVTVTVCFCKMKIFPVQLLQTFIPYFTTEWKFAQWINMTMLILLTWTVDRTTLHAELNLGIICSVWFFQWMWLSVCECGYQFVNQQVLYSLFRLIYFSF